MMDPNQFTTPYLKWSELKPSLELGDLIEFRRVVGGMKSRMYSHWAVVIAHNDNKVYVAHLSLGENDFKIGQTGKKDSCVKINCGNKAEVRRDELSLVAGNDLCRINNSLDVSNRPYPPTVIVERANIKLGTQDYSLLFNNCEHFAKHCRYGTKESDQATVVKTLLFGGLGFLLSGSVPIAVTAGCAGYALGSFLKKRHSPCANLFS